MLHGRLPGEFGLLSLLRDSDLIRDARAEVIELVSPDPDLTGHPVLAAAVAALVDEESAEYLEWADGARSGVPEPIRPGRYRSVHCDHF